MKEPFAPDLEIYSSNSSWVRSFFDSSEFVTDEESDDSSFLKLVFN